MSMGKFITLEGGEGTGKSTNLAFMAQLLTAKGIDLVETREPGGTELAEKVRQLLLDKKNIDMADDTELLLMFAARSQHIQQKILPALANGQWVLCDRFTDSTFAYQGAGRGISVDRIAQLEDWVQQGLQPDLTILLDLPIETGLERAAKRAALDRFESEQIDFFQRVRSGFLQRARQHADRFRVIDSSRSLFDVQKQIQVELECIL